ncbi:MAG: hypothetical protein ABL962_02945 [Fimbriimonadaceae bacterium]
MNQTCREFRAELADVAEGALNPAARNHIGECASCAAFVAELTVMISAAARKRYEAPAETILRAQALFVPRKRTVMANLLNLGTTGARSAGSELTQLRLEAEDIQLMLMIRPDGDGWRVMGMIEGELPLSGHYADDALDLDGSRFEFLTHDLGQDVWLEYADRHLRFPLTMNA